MREAGAAVTWAMVTETLTRPYRVTVPMIVLVLLVPVYLFIPEWTPVDGLYAPEIGLDRLIPLQPAWSLVYGALYAFLIVLPVLIVREEEHIRRTVHAYLFVWIAAYVCFLVYPTVAPRPDRVDGDGFAVWGLRSLYGADPPYNCFPSLHVAHSFVSALTCLRLHRLLGIGTAVCALLVGVSTLYTKQHYVLDMVAGMLLASVAYVLFLRSNTGGPVPERDRRVAPVVALMTLALMATGVVMAWAVWTWTDAGAARAAALH